MYEMGIETDKVGDQSIPRYKNGNEVLGAERSSTHAPYATKRKPVTYPLHGRRELLVGKFVSFAFSILILLP